MSRAPSDSLDEKYWEGNLANLISKPFLSFPAFFCQDWSVASGGMELSPRRSEEFRGRPELQNGGLRALLLDGRVLDTSGFLCSRGVSGWLQEVSICVPGGPRRSGNPRANS